MADRFTEDNVEINPTFAVNVFVENVEIKALLMSNVAEDNEE